MFRFVYIFTNFVGMPTKIIGGYIILSLRFCLPMKESKDEGRSLILKIKKQ